MAIARFVLKTLPGIDRPAIASQLPTRKGVDHRARPRRQRRLHARAAAAVRGDGQRAGRRRSTASSGPTVGLLNIGEEEIKGNELVKQTASCCARRGLNFYGNVEGNDIFKGTTDVVVCDGFVGNVALKTSEGLARCSTRSCKEEFTRNAADASSPRSSRMPVLRALQAPRRPAPLQRRDAARPEGHGRQEPRLGRRARVQLRAAQGVRGSRARRARQDRAAHGDDGRARAPTRRAVGRSDGRRCIAASPAPAATCRRSPHQRRPRAARRHERRVDRRAHRHPRSATSPRRRRDDQRPRAARRARARSRPPASRRADVDLIIVATSTPDMVFPSTACLAAGEARRRTAAPAFDVQAVCSGFVYALADRRPHDRSRRGAATRWWSAPRCISRILDWNDRSTCVLFGDGAGAVVLVPSRHAGHPGQRPARRRPLRATSCACRARVAAARSAATPFAADGRPGGVQVRGAGAGRGRRAKRSPPSRRRRDADIDWLIPHQANIRIMERRRRS